MDKKVVLKKVEAYVKKRMSSVKDTAHDFNHVDRVMKWALKIAKKERFSDLFLLQIAALLHDIGRTETDHYAAGARIAGRYLKSLAVFSEREIRLICRAVYGHGAGGREKIIKILRDADRFDLLGAIGIARAFTYLCGQPYYLDGRSFQGGRWIEDRSVNRTYKSKNRPWMKSVADGLNFNLDHRERFDTETAKTLSREKVKFLKKFIKQLKKETIDLK